MQLKYQTYIADLFNAMELHSYYNGESAKIYYRTMISVASLFARDNNAAVLFKQCNDTTDLQNVIGFVI
jgi:hypothetical protein